MSLARRGAVRLLTGLILFGATTSAAGQAPWWSELPAPVVPVGNSPASILTVEHEVRISANGQVTESERGAIRIHHAEGRALANCVVPYEQGTTQILGLRGWIQPPHGPLVELSRSDATDFVVLGSGVLFSDSRALMLSAAEAPVGSLFVYEWSTRSPPLVAQWEWGFQRVLPVERSRFVLQAPEESEVRAIGAPKAVETTHAGGRWSWELRGLTPWKPEPLALDSRGRRDQQLRVSVRSNLAKSPAGMEYENWHAVARWLQKIAQPSAETDAAVSARAQELTRGASSSLSQARSIAEFVQRTNYAAINLGLGMGFGYRPRPASAVLRTGYGDCKDKANLACVLLRSIGVEAWLVSVYSGDRHHVRADWPTPCQFNHCIVALRSPAGVRGSAMAEQSPFGDILFFDPTDPCTRFGELPLELQGSLGLIISDQTEDLIRLPQAPHAETRQAVLLSGRLNEDGGLIGELRISERGAVASAARCRVAEGPGRLRETDQSSLVNSLRKVSISGWVVEDHRDSSLLERRMSLDAPGFANRVGDRLMSLSPVLSRLAPELPDTGRVEAITIDPTSLEVVMTLALPPRWTPDEIPPDRTLRTEFGALEMTWKATSERLEYRLHLDTEAALLPAERYDEVRRFFAVVREAQRAPVVLVAR